MSILIKNCSIVDSLKDYPEDKDILIEGKIIKKIESNIDAAADVVLDARGLTIIPGLIDMHTHLREPGLTHKESVRSGSMAAARGGYTTICCMPNTKPVIDDEHSLALLIDIINKDAAINVLPIAAVTVGENSTKLTDMVKLRHMGAVAFSDDGKPVSNNLLMQQALKLSHTEGFLVIDHCEDLSLVNGGVINEGLKSKELGLKGISGLSEELPVMRDIMLAQEADARIHIAHISTKKSAQIIRDAKEKHALVTCEVTPHHIALTDNIIEAGSTDCKVNPPLRTIEDVQALKQGLKDGTIDVIATDHAPHHADDKGSDFYSAANGISGIETAFSVCYTELVASGLLTLKQLVQKMSLNPAVLLKLDRGEIGEGKVADLTIVDLNMERTIDKNTFLSKGKNTPFHGRKYKGEVMYTIVNGKIAYKSEEE